VFVIQKYGGGFKAGDRLSGTRCNGAVPPLSNNFGGWGSLGRRVTGCEGPAGPYDRQQKAQRIGWADIGHKAAAAACCYSIE